MSYFDAIDREYEILEETLEAADEVQSRLEEDDLENEVIFTDWAAF